MKARVRRFIRATKTRLVWKIVWAINWNSDHVLGPAWVHDSRFGKALGRWIEDRLHLLFHRCYVGSDQEIADGIEYAQDNVPDAYLTPHQREIKHRLAEWLPLQNQP